MVHFIARESDPGKCIEDLRKEMLSNTLSILRLLNERRRIAVEIGRAKATSGLPARVPEQEERVIRQIGSDDPVVARDINLLFELSTQWQKRSDISAPREVSISGDPAGLEFILGSLCGSPGRIAEDTEGTAFASAFLMKGGHISRARGNPVLVCIGSGRQGCAAEIRDGVLHAEDLEGLTSPTRPVRVVRE
ncbi:hypothetical protein GCM10007108_15930 [Thermogymnomonas acidicola]|uniref:Chorismate mutase domain-containing protein n=1 Tax=Thermogymnomonas acidicola TaxID=399579 RepID=A0AA37BSR8_9ARCH|nr:chorismate mutase [Thermogymnomonas acidicola]GGM78572.1 hypothetical protein GCM10007108_15930 [Thermogymnomonas acidicola]